MTRNAVICMIMGWILSASILGWAENSQTIVRVLTANKVEGIDGVVVLLNPGDAHKSRAFITDRNGAAHLSDINCNTCIIAALDPRGLFFNTTTEFDGRSSFVTLIMQVRPIVNKVGEPGAVLVEITVNDPAGAPLENQNVILRPREMTLRHELNWFFTETTDLNGKIKVKLLPGEYTIARLVSGEAWEAPFSVIMKRSKKCAEEEKKLIQSSLNNTNPKDFLTVRLSETNVVSSEK